MRRKRLVDFWAIAIPHDQSISRTILKGQVRAYLCVSIVYNAAFERNLLAFDIMSYYIFKLVRVSKWIDVTGNFIIQYQHRLRFISFAWSYKLPSAQWINDLAFMAVPEAYILYYLNMPLTRWRYFLVDFVPWQLFFLAPYRGVLIYSRLPSRIVQ